MQTTQSFVSKRLAIESRIGSLSMSQMFLFHKAMTWVPWHQDDARNGGKTIAPLGILRLNLI